MTQCSCGSYAFNDDPKGALCDTCWRDKRIETLTTLLKQARFCLDAYYCRNSAGTSKLCGPDSELAERIEAALRGET
jgi:hypothetical protein